MANKENLEIKKAPETLTEQDLEKVGGGGHNGCISIEGGSLSCISD